MTTHGEECRQTCAAIGTVFKHGPTKFTGCDVVPISGLESFRSAANERCPRHPSCRYLPEQTPSQPILSVSQPNLCQVNSDNERLSRHTLASPLQHTLPRLNSLWFCWVPASAPRTASFKREEATRGEENDDCSLPGRRYIPVIHDGFRSDSRSFRIHLRQSKIGPKITNCRNHNGKPCSEWLHKLIGHIHPRRKASITRR